MKNQNIDKAVVDVNPMEKSERVFARLVSRKLTAEEVEKVAGGAKKSRCTRTKYPNVDVICS